MATPHSVATARGVCLFASDLPESSLCLLVCLRVLLGGVNLGFSGSGCSSGWLVGVRFPSLGSVSGLSTLVPVAQVSLWAVRGFCLVDGSLSAGFCLGLQVSSPSFHSPRPRSLSLGPSCSSLSPLGLSWLALVSVLATLVAWIVPRLLLVAYLLVSLRFFTVIFRSLFTTFLVGSSSSAFAGCPSSPFFWIVWGVDCSSWLSPLPSARL